MSLKIILEKYYKLCSKRGGNYVCCKMTLCSASLRLCLWSTSGNFCSFLLHKKRGNNKHEANLFKSEGGWETHHQHCTTLPHLLREQKHTPDWGLSAVYKALLAGTLFDYVEMDGQRKALKCVSFLVPSSWHLQIKSLLIKRPSNGRT